MSFFNSSMLGISINTITNQGGYVDIGRDNKKKGGKKKDKLRFNGEPETRTAEQRCLLRWSR